MLPSHPAAFLGPFLGYRSASRYLVTRRRLRAHSPSRRALYRALVALAVFGLALAGSLRAKHATPAPAAREAQGANVTWVL